ncbi:MAG: fumarylacetoacetate hydrolase family protein [Planctomycetes bacterium]|nr:fumarylacetoacetate hydrolase family protein [Planctomycetota bacterium]
MRLFRFGARGEERPAVLMPDGRRLDCSAFDGDFGPDFFARDGLIRLATFVRSHEGDLPSVPADARFGSCVGRPHKLFCIGLNYRDHARETGAELPKEPVIFAKATSAVCGPNDDLVIPKGSTKTDWEVELVVVIGETARYVDKEQAMRHVAGYTVHNDYSERHWQLERGGQWVKGKSFDTFAPLGPYFVSRDEIADPHRLPLWLDVNGERLQQSNTGEMAFGVADLVSYLSHCLTLEPGDCISTGTPAGVGLGLDPPRFVAPGDVIELGIDGLGSQRQLAVPFEA